MQQQFFGARVEIPDRWANRSVAVFVSPPLENERVPSMSRQQRLAAGSVALSPPSTAAGRSAAQEMEARLRAAAQELEGLRVEEPAVVEQLAGREIAIATCRGRSAGGLEVRQLLAIVRQGDELVGVTCTAPAPHFAAVRETLLAVVRSIQLGP